MAGRSDIQAGGAFVRLFLKDEMTKKLVRTLRNAGQKIQNIGASVVKLGAPIMAMGAAITGVLAGAVKHFASVGDHLNKMSLRTGIAAGSLAELGFAAEQSGTDLDVVEKAIRRQQKNIRDLERGLSTAVDAFDALGLSLDNLKGKSPEDQFELITERLGALEDPTMKAAIAQEVFGRAGTALIPMLGNLKALKAEARELGIIPTEEEVQNAAKVTDAINRVRRTVTKMVFDVGAALAEPALAALDVVKKITVASGKWVKENASLVKIIAAVGGGLLVAGAIITGAGVAIIGVGMAISALGTIISSIGAVLGAVLSPVGLVTVALVAGVAAWIKYTDSGKKTVRVLSGLLGELLAVGKQTFGGIFDAIKSGNLKLAGQIAFTGLQLAAAEGLDALRSLVGDTVANIGGQLLGGDFSGAWATAVDGMMLVWESFAKGVVDVFAGAVDAVVNAWQSATTAISDFILESAAQEGVMGDIARSILGVDMRDEQAKAETMDAARKEVGKRNLEWARKQVAAELEQARAVGDDELIAKKEKHLATIDTELAELQTGVKMPDVVADAKQAAADILQTQADTAREALDQVRKDAEARQQEAADQLVGRNKQTQSDLKAKADEARRKLDELTAKANQASKDARATKGSLFGGSKFSLAGEGMAGIDMSGIKSTFSAQAAIEMGYGSKSPQQQMAGDIRKMLPKLDMQLGELFKIRLDFQKMVGALKHP